MTNPQIFSVLDDMPGAPAGTVNPEKLEAEIIASAITKTLVVVRTDEDVLTITFDDALTAGDETILHGDTTGPAGGLLAAHDNVMNPADPPSLFIDGSNWMTGPLQILEAASVGYSRLGTGVSDHGLSAVDDLLITGKTEFNGDVYLDAKLRIANNFEIILGSSSNAWLDWSTGQASPSLIWATASLIFTTTGNRTKNHDHSSSTDPILIMTSATDPDTDNMQFGSWHHDQTNVVFTAGRGAHSFVNTPYSDAPGTTGSGMNAPAWTFTDDDTAQDGTAPAWTAYSFQAPTLAAENTGVITTDAATFYIEGPPVAGTNQTITNPLAIWVGAGVSRFDGAVKAQDGLTVQDSNGANHLILQIGGVTYGVISVYIDDGLHIAPKDTNSTANNNVIITASGNNAKDHDHDTLSPDPTLFMQSDTNPDTDNTQWGSLTHNKTDFVLNAGKGMVKFAVGITMADAKDININTTTGTKIGTGVTQKIGFWDAAPVIQESHIVDATDADDVITRVNALLLSLETIGILASA